MIGACLAFMLQGSYNEKQKPVTEVSNWGDILLIDDQNVSFDIAMWWSVLFRTDQQGGPNPGPQNYCCSFSSCSCPTCCHWPGSGVFHHWEASRTKLFGKEAGHGPRGQNPPHAWYTGSLWLALPPVQQRSPELCKYGADHVYEAKDRWLNGRIRLWSFSLLCYFKMKASVKV